MTNEIINTKAIRKMELEAQIKVLKTEIAKLDAELQSELDSREEDMIETNQFRIFFKLTESQVLDQKMLKADFPEVAEKCTKAQVKTYFKVNPLK